MAKLISMLRSVCCTFVAASAVIAQAAPAQATHDQLKLVIILSRHGVRSPTWTLDRLNAYSAKPWPTWSAAPGELTAHGYKLLETFGAYDRELFAGEGLFNADACANAAATTLWADTDQRTLASGHALAAGLFPACTPQIYSLAEGQNDPLFHPTADAVPASTASAAFAEFNQHMLAQPVTPDDPLLHSMQNVLNGCPPAVACTPQHSPRSTLFDVPSAVVRGKGDHIAELQGPLPLASTLSEDLLLEYTEGMPTADVGWGNVDEDQLRRLIALHTRYFDSIHRTPALARLGSGAMLQRIVETMQQTVEGKPVAGALAPAQKKLVILVGHDTNLAGVAALLGVHWSLDGREDDTSPGTELVFELRQSATKQYYVRTIVRQQTLQQMRSLRPLTLAAPPAESTLRPSGCSAELCPWSDFQAATLASVANR